MYSCFVQTFPRATHFPERLSQVSRSCMRHSGFVCGFEVVEREGRRNESGAGGGAAEARGDGTNKAQVLFK